MMKGGGAVMSEVGSVVVERVEDGCGVGNEKERKKNRRRSNRQSKLNSVNPPPASSSVNEVKELPSHASSDANKKKIRNVAQGCSSSRQVDSEAPSTASNVVFNSMPMMRDQSEHLVPGDVSVSSLSMSCSDPVQDRGLQANGGLCMVHPQFEGHPQGKIYNAYWSMEAVNEALERGYAFKSLFRVNAHNRVEAYCKVDGVPTDILISGYAAQNRAVEGDTVVIKIDPLYSWARMKGSNGPTNRCEPVEDSKLLGSEAVDASGKGKTKVDEFGVSVSSMPSQEENGLLACDLVNGYNSSVEPSVRQNGVEISTMQVDNAVEKLCTFMSFYPSKRPTGKVVAIIEKSPRRDGIVGFLNAKQWFYYREGYGKDPRRNTSPLPVSDNEYIQVTPTDPKFPKLSVCVGSLPSCIKKRLEEGDKTLDSDLVAAHIKDWTEESPSPEACIARVFGRGSEMEPQISAILYENAICVSDFSPESLSCLPVKTWAIPEEEIRLRRDLRHLCAFTIDPLTATDLDDALSVEILADDTVRIGVHIADASYFVSPSTSLDLEAQNRSTSVYMVRGKLPMLPPALSENVGSLNPGVNRLAFSIFWDLSGNGDVLDRWIGRTVMQSCCKLSYEHAQNIIDGNCNFDGMPQLYGQFEWNDIIKSVNVLHKLSKALRKRRFDDGALQLESSKVVFLFDEYGMPYDCRFSERKESNSLVEEFMLLANTTAAEIISRAFPESALLRRHPEPNMRKLREFETFCSKHGFVLDTSSSGKLHRSLEWIRERLEGDTMFIDILVTYATKSMQLATYFCSGDLKINVNEWGHYALAVPLYTHFTSPLRRYSDIIVHRTLNAVLEAEKCYMNRCSHGVLRNEDLRCFTGINFDRDAAESLEGREALFAAALKYGVPSTDVLADLAAHCNVRKLASRHVKDSCDKLYMWMLLKKKKVLLSEARVIGLGPRFMSVYIQKLAMERRVHYDEVEGLSAEWLEATSTLVLSICPNRRSSRRASSNFRRSLSEVAWVVNPSNTEVDPASVSQRLDGSRISRFEIDPAVSPLTVRILSTIPVALHALGGDDGPLDIGVSLFISSYFS
ncbi:DIS3-like exonuclease 2 [Linum grandiflorum]